MNRLKRLYARLVGARSNNTEDEGSFSRILLQAWRNINEFEARCGLIGPRICLEELSSSGPFVRREPTKGPQTIGQRGFTTFT